MLASVVAIAFAGLVAAGSTIAGCAREYTVQDGDYCDAISASHNSSTYQLAVSNYKTINDGCTNLDIGQVICLGNTGQDCANTYVVQPNDYCDLISYNHGINSTMLRTNNPQIDDNCYNLYVGEVLCVANQALVTPAPAGWTLPGANLDDGDFVSSGDDVVNHAASTHTTTPAKASKTTTTKSAATTTKPATTTTKAPSTKDNDEDDEDDDCEDY